MAFAQPLQHEWQDLGKLFPVADSISAKASIEFDRVLGTANGVTTETQVAITLGLVFSANKFVLRAKSSTRKTTPQSHANLLLQARQD